MLFIGHVGEALKASLDARDVKRVLLDFSQVNFIDISASDELLGLIKELKNRGITLAFCARARRCPRRYAARWDRGYCGLAQLL